MSDEPVVRIPNWDTFQHYKDRSPPWIKLHRQLLNNRNWNLLSGDAGKLLVDLWLVAAESDDGSIASGTDDLAWRLRRSSEEMARLLVELEKREFLDLSVHDASVVIAGCLQPASTEGEGERAVEVQERDIKKPGTPRVEEVEYTQGQLLAAAKAVCGLGLWDRQEESRAHSVLVSWCGEGIAAKRVWAAIQGSRILVDAGKVEWLPAHKPYGLRALRNTGTLYEQGDGKAARPLFDVCEEAYYADASPAKARRATSGPQRASFTVPESDGGFAA